MYKHLLRPLLFKIAPETIHHLIVWLMRIVHYIPGGRWLIRSCFTIHHPSLEREVFGLRFPNPVGLAAGFDKDAEVYEEIAALGFGFVEVGTITPKPQPGNPRPRLFRLPQDQALINRMGFNNRGQENAVRNLRRRSWYDPYRRKRRPTLLGGNLGKNTLTPNEAAPADYLRLFRSLYEYVNYFVINVSCPNVTDLTHLQDKENLRQILRGLVEFRRGQNQYRPILLKISPDLNKAQIDDMIEVMMECGIDGIVATNTTTSREGLKTPPETLERIGKGGLSGAPLTERSREVVRYIHEKTQGNFPIIGVGGIMTPDDAIAMLDAGASLIQVYSGFIYNGPSFVRKICKRLKQRAEHPENTSSRQESTSSSAATPPSAETPVETPDGTSAETAATPPMTPKTQAGTTISIASSLSLVQPSAVATTASLPQESPVDKIESPVSSSGVSRHPTIMPVDAPATDHPDITRIE